MADTKINKPSPLTSTSRPLTKTGIEDQGTTVPHSEKSSQLSVSVKEPLHANDELVIEHVFSSPEIEQALFHDTKQSPQEKKEHAPDKSNELHMNPSRILGMYGLKSAQDVIKFLKTPAGATTKKEIHDLNDMLIAMKEAQQQRNLDAQIRRHRLFAFLLLAIVYKKHAHAKKLNEAIQKQIDKALEHGKKVLKQLEAAAHKDEPIVINAHAHSHIEAAYAATRQIIEGALEQKMQESETLVKEIETLIKEGEKITKRYAAFAIHLDDLDTHYDALEAAHASLTPEAKIKALEQSIKQTLAEVNEKIGKYQSKIDLLLSANKDEEALDLIHDLNGLNAQAISMHDMLAVFRQEKAFYNSAGEIASSFKDADFILSIQMKIVKDQQGQFYLLPQSEDLTDANKQAAAERFKQEEPKISNLKKIIRNNKNLEFEQNAQRLDSAFQRSEEIQKEIIDLTNQHAQIDAAWASAASLAKQPNPSPESASRIPIPKPTPMAQTKSSKEVVTQSYKQMVRLMQPNVTPDGIGRLRNLTQSAPDMRARVDSLRPNKPMPNESMRFFLANIERFGISAYKHGPVPRPAPRHEEHVKKEADTYTPISPFQIKPPGY